MVRHLQKVNDRVADRDFKYYIFDWDDNILHMPTRIHLERKRPDGTWEPHTVSTAAFAVLRAKLDQYRPPHGNWDEAFIEFQDPDGSRESRFLTDTRIALRKLLSGEATPGPSFEKLRETLREGRLFAIVTARGHDPQALRAAVRLFAEMALTPADREEMMANLRGYRRHFDKVEQFGTDEEEFDYYLSLNRYHAVTNPKFKQWMAREASMAQPENAKQFAIRDFVEHVIRILSQTGADSLKRPISVGFSDDDLGNVHAVETYIQEVLAERFPGIKFCIYDTSDPTIADGKKVIVSGQMDFGF
ncbi:MAG: hypothetical protein J6334_11585 [Kiritimatiellae bacterium]|nr:hypothetical protein [Kiritimatiellia bacterium]